MAVESVRKLVERYKEIGVILKSLSKELEDLQKSHKTFWIRLEQECYKTCHDFTLEQLQWWHNYDNCIPENRTPITSLTIWQLSDRILGKSSDYESRILELRRELYPRNPDAYYDD